MLRSTAPFWIIMLGAIVFCSLVQSNQPQRGWMPPPHACKCCVNPQAGCDAIERLRCLNAQLGSGYPRVEPPVDASSFLNRGDYQGRSAYLSQQLVLDRRLLRSGEATDGLLVTPEPIYGTVKPVRRP